MAGLRGAEPLSLLSPCVVTGMMWSECKELWLEGPREYIVQLWNVLDFGMLSIFIAAFTARFLAFLQATKAQQYVDSYVQESDLSEVTLPPEIQYFTYGESLAGGRVLVLPCFRRRLDRLSEGDARRRGELGGSERKQQELQSRVPIQADAPGLGDCVQGHLLPCAFVFRSVGRSCCCK